MPEPKKVQVKQLYIFTQKDMKEKLGIKGDITQMGLWSSLSPTQEKEGKPKDPNVWFIQTTEGDEIEEET